MNKIKPAFGTTLAVFALAFCFSQSAVAVGVTQVWAVSSTSKINCGNSQHGLWTNSLNPSTSSCSNYFSIDGTLTEYGDGTAVLDATATNLDSVVADIDITFSGHSTTHSPVKTGGGFELSDWYYYESITGGTVVIGGITYDNLGMVGGYALQIGDGANDKTGEFGASVWFVATDGSYNPNLHSNKHWDLNLELQAVPVPAAVWLFGSGLIGLVAVTRRKRQA